MQIRNFFILTLCFFVFQSYGQNKWFGGNGDYGDPANWSYGEVPNLDHEVEIGAGEVTFPANGTYYAGNFIVTKNVVLNFEGQDSDGANIEIGGHVYLEESVTMLYDAMGSESSWTFVGENVNHELNPEGNDLNHIYLNEEDSQIELESAVVASYRIRIENGTLVTNNEDITTGLFWAGAGCSGVNCLPKVLDLGQSEITCDEWRATYNYGTLSINGTYTIKAAQFKGGSNDIYHNVVLTDFVPVGSWNQFLNLDAHDNVFNDLIIDNMYDSKIAGDFTVLGEFKVVNQSTTILITTKTFSTPAVQWSFQGSVNLVEDQNGCPDFTIFKRHLSISDDFTFHTIDSDLEFDWAIIDNIPTTGGGSFTINNGYSIGFNEDWIAGSSLTIKNLYWIGGSGQWDDGNNWSASSGGAPGGCAPSFMDNVIFDEFSFSSSSETVTLDYGKSYGCRNFIWESMPHNAQLIDQSTSGEDLAELAISGKVDIDMPDIFDFESTNFILISNDEVDINSDSPLPPTTIASVSSYYLLGPDLVFDGTVNFVSGSIDTEGHDLTINGNLLQLSEFPKNMYLNDSEITIIGKANFGDIYQGNVVVDAGTSKISCGRFTTSANTFNIVEINDNAENAINSQYENAFIRKLIINEGTLRLVQCGIDIDSLIFNGSGTRLELDGLETSNINKAIVSNVISGTAPIILRGSGSGDSKINFPIHNFCILDEIEFENIEAISSNLVNVPNGIDGGSNSGFNFTPTPSFTGTLYWIGGDGEISESINWSQGSGQCPTDEDPSVADVLIWDDQSLSSTNDTIRVESSATLNSLQFNNSPSDFNLMLSSDLIIKDLEIKSSNTNIRTTNDRDILLDHHAHVTNNALLLLDKVDITVGRKPSTLTQTAFFVENSSTFVSQENNISLAGHTNDNSKPTLEFEDASTVTLIDCNLLTKQPIVEEPIRDIVIQANNNLFNYFVPTMFNTSDQKVIIDGHFSCKTLSLIDNYGDLVIKDNVIFRVEGQ